MSDRLSEIEGRLAQMTPGPWHRDRTTHMGGYTISVRSPHVTVADGLLKRDAELIAHAPDDLAALVKFAREVSDLRESLRRFQALRVDVNRDSILRTLDAAFTRLEAP